VVRRRRKMISLSSKSRHSHFSHVFFFSHSFLPSCADPIIYLRLKKVMLLLLLLLFLAFRISSSMGERESGTETSPKIWRAAVTFLKELLIKRHKINSGRRVYLNNNNKNYECFFFFSEFQFQALLVLSECQSPEIWDRWSASCPAIAQQFATSQSCRKKCLVQFGRRKCSEPHGNCAQFGASQS